MCHYVQGGTSHSVEGRAGLATGQIIACSAVCRRTLTLAGVQTILLLGSVHSGPTQEHRPAPPSPAALHLHAALHRLNPDQSKHTNWPSALLVLQRRKEKSK